MIYVIAILAKAGHGKTTVAKYTEETYGAKRVSLADPLKKIAQRTMGFSDEQLYGSQEAKEANDPRYGISPRTYLQRLGSAIRDELGKDVWVRALVDRVRAEHDASDGAQEVFVIDDTRFPNELSFLENCEDIREVCIKVVCTDAPDSGTHESETGIDKVYPEQIAATVISSKAQGTGHLIREFGISLAALPALAPIWRALMRQRTERKAA